MSNKIRRCRACGTPKGAKKDPCNNPDCSGIYRKVTQFVHAHGHNRKPIVATKSHGFHAPLAREMSFQGGWA